MQFHELKLGDYFKYNHTIYKKTVPFWSTNFDNVVNSEYISGPSSLFYQVLFLADEEIVQVFPYKVAVEWSMFHEVEVYEENLEEAIKIIEENESLVDVNSDGEYEDGSFEVNRQVTKILNKENNESN